MRTRRLVLAVLGAAYALFWIGGIYARTSSGPPAPQWAAPVFLLLSAAIAALASSTPIPALLFAIGGFCAELIGVHTGIPFGHYQYSNALGPSLAAVPLAISCAWVTLLVWARDLAWRLTGHSISAALTGAALMVLADLLIDPVATRVLGYWHWQQPGFWFGVPAENFAGWFVVSAMLLLASPKPIATSRWSVAIGTSTLAFFALILLLFYRR